MKRFSLRLLLVVASGLAVVLLTAGPAAAHASLLSVDPPDGSRLDTGPEAITLTFSEPVSVDLGGVRVIDGDGQRVDEGAARVDGGVVTVDLADDLTDGTYVISYRVVSADGHPVRGGSVFGIGDGAVDTGALSRVTDSDDRIWEVVGAVARGFAYAGILVAAGGALFLVGAHRDPSAPEHPRAVKVIRIAALIGGITAAVALPIQAALGTGQGPMSIFESGVLGNVADDGLGHSLLLAVVGLLLVGFGVGRSAPMVIVGSFVASGSFAATGHTRAGDTATLATLADIAHLVAAAAWAGGLVLVWLTLRIRRRNEADPVESGRIVARFSRLATAGILVVGVAGIALSWSEVRSVSALTSTRYGWLLIAKVALVAGIAVLGAYNHFRLVPAIERGKARAALGQLHHTLRLEVAALVGVAALTSVLVVLTPAKAAEGGGVVERIVDLGEAGSAQIVVAPARAGENQIHIYTYDPDGRTADIAESVSLELSQPDAGIGPIDREAVRAGPAHLQLDTQDLVVAGDWEITIRARVDRFDEATATFTVPVAR